MVELKQLVCLLCLNTTYNFDFFRYPLLDLCPNLSTFAFSSSQDLSGDVSYLHDKTRTSQLTDFNDFDDMGVLYSYMMVDVERLKKCVKQATSSTATRSTIVDYLNAAPISKLNWLVGDYDQLHPLTTWRNTCSAEDEREFLKAYYP